MGRVDRGTVDIRELFRQGGCLPLNPRRRYQVGRVDWGTVDIRELFRQGGCTPLNPRRRYQVGRVDWGSKSNLLAPIQAYRLVGFAPTAGDSVALPLGVYETGGCTS